MIAAAEKSIQRRAGKAARQALSPSQRAAAQSAVCALLCGDAALSQAKTILCYRACGAEADCAAFCLAAKARGARIAYPRCTTPGQMEARLPTAAVWEPDAFGIPAPAPEQSVLVLPQELDAVLVPLTVFDADCRRIGMGGGFYDRYLPRCQRALRCGIAFSVQQSAQVDCKPWDAVLDAIFTEERVFRRPEMRKIETIPGTQKD